MSFLQNLVKEIDDDFTSIASDAKGSSEFSGYIDTGCYMLNAILSGSLYGGVPDNKITAFAGESATGKTFFALSIVNHFLQENDTNVVVYYDTEAAITSEMMKSRGIDTSRVIIAEPTTIQSFRTHALRVIDAYEKKKDDKPRMLMVLDSLGMLSTTKEMEDTAEGKETRDMTKAQLIKATFRVLTLKLAKVKVPLILTNHVYDAVGSFFPTKEISGGSGLKYAASTIALLGKKKDKDGTDVVGNFIRTKMYKSRLSKENSEVLLKLSYSKGLDKYYGLLDLAEKYNIIEKSGRQYVLPDGSKVFGKAIIERPAEVFTNEIMEKLEVAARKEYSYGEYEGEDESDREETTREI